MKTMYAVSFGLTVAGVICNWIEDVAEARSPLQPSPMGYLLLTAGLLLLVVCLVASLEQRLQRLSSGGPPDLPGEEPSSTADHPHPR